MTTDDHTSYITVLKLGRYYVVRQMVWSAVADAFAVYREVKAESKQGALQVAVIWADYGKLEVR